MGRSSPEPTKKIKRKKPPRHDSDSEEETEKSKSTSKKKHQHKEKKMKLIHKPVTSFIETISNGLVLPVGFGKAEQQLKLDKPFTFSDINDLKTANHFLQEGSGCKLIEGVTQLNEGDMIPEMDAIFDPHKVNKSKIAKNSTDSNKARYNVHLEASQENPLLLQGYMEARSKLVPPRYFNIRNPLEKISPEVAHETVRSGLGMIPRMTFEWESQLMIPAMSYRLKDGRLISLPKCRMKEQCVGMTDYAELGMDKGYILCAMFWPVDMEAVIGLNPNLPKPDYELYCVLCHRKICCDNAQFARNIYVIKNCTSDADKAKITGNSNGAFTSNLFVTLTDKKEIFQKWGNYKDHPLGYHRRHFFGIDEYKDEGICVPLVSDSYSCIKAVRETHIAGLEIPGGYWRLAQIGMQWKPAEMPEPKTGESVNSFSSGVGSK